MAWLTLNGINVGGLAAHNSLPRGDRRDIGDLSTATDGSMRVTRQKRKHDLALQTVPLLATDALSWESYIVGEGERWSFDSSLYGSKGLGPNAGYVATQVAGSPKFGAGVLRITATTGTITWAGAALNTSGSDANVTVMVWRYESSTWHHYTVRNNGAKWLDGARNDGVDTSWLTVAGSVGGAGAPDGTGNVKIAAISGSACDYDDLVVLPFYVLDAWPPVFGVAAAAFSNLPYLTAAGDLVREVATRSVLGKCSEVAVAVGRRSTSLQHDLRTLAVELQEA